MRSFHTICPRQPAGKDRNGRRAGVYAQAGVLFLCILALLLAACDSGNKSAQSPYHQTVQTNTGETISYSTQPQDVLIRLLFGGGKVGALEFTPQVSIYGDGTFILGPGLQLQKGSLTSDQLQNLLQTLASTDNLLNLQHQIFDDVPNQNTTLLQVALNNKNYQFVYGPFGNVQESSQEMQEYRQLGDAISTIKGALNGPETAYTSQNQALLVYKTSRLDFTAVQDANIATWTLADISLSDAATAECGVIKPDPNNPRPNLDNGCLTYTVPQAAYQPDVQDLQSISDLLQGQQQGMFIENGAYYVVMLRPLLPDEIVTQQLAMYGSAAQTYTPIPLKEGAIPTPTPTS